MVPDKLMPTGFLTSAAFSHELPMVAAGGIAQLSSVTALTFARRKSECWGKNVGALMDRRGLFSV